MAEERKSWFARSLIMDILVAGAIVPYLKELAEKVIKKLGSHAEKTLGLLDFESSKHQTADDYLFMAAQASLTADEIVKVYDFKHKLMHFSDDKERALILYVANMLNQFAREKKEARGGGKSGRPREEFSYKDLSEGIVLATRFFKNLLSKSNADPDLDFSIKVEFLENEHVFELIPEKKDDPLAPVKKKMREAGKSIKDASTEIGKMQKENADEWDRQASAFKARGKSYFENAKKRR